MDDQVVGRSLNDINVCFSKILLDSNTDRTASTISWRNYKPGIDKGFAYAAVYQRLIDSRQYSFLLEDNSFFQFFFEWENQELRKAKLAFYPTPVKISGALNSLLESAELSGVDLLEELYFGAEAWVNRGIDIVNTSYIRLDYDSKVDTHSKCHIQVASINEIRITSQYLINPFNFFTWITEHLKFKQFDSILASHGYLQALNYHRTRNHDFQMTEASFPYLSSLNT